MDGAVTGQRATHSYRTVDVAVSGGMLRVAVWDPLDPPAADVLLAHGVTASHLAWANVAEHLPGVRVIAPDLRGRGASRSVEGGAGLASHADDLAAVLDAFGIDRIPVVGHSMGAFVAVVLAHRHPRRVSRLILVDGGLPLDVPHDVDPDTVVASTLGPTAARLSMRFGDIEEYFDFWREHPAFQGEWSPELERYLAYDLVDDGADGLRPATSYATTVEDVIDMTTGTALPAALDALRHPTRLVTVPRGLRGELPGLYSEPYLAAVLPRFSTVAHERVDGFNHYTIVMSDAGADAVAAVVRDELAATD